MFDRTVNAREHVGVAARETVVSGIHQSAVEKDHHEVGGEIESEADCHVHRLSRGTLRADAIKRANAESDTEEASPDDDECNRGEEREDDKLLVHREDMETYFDEPEATRDRVEHQYRLPRQLNEAS